jgi:hypothetical protein
MPLMPDPLRERAPGRAPREPRDPAGEAAMQRLFKWVLAAAAVFVLTSGVASACTISGVVKCDATGEGVGGAVLRLTGPDGYAVTTGPDGTYTISPPGPGEWTITIDLSGVEGGTVVSPGAAQTFTIVGAEGLVQDWVVTAARCTYGACWLTGGGAKFSAITGTLLAEKGPQISFGGNVNPGCSPTAGDGGQWNHLDHGRKLHFQGQSIEVTDCGNVSGIPPGSTSPVTPYNYIEFRGTGRLNPLAGYKPAAPLPATVCFTARAEDRNEPGSSGQRDGARIDRYFLRVTNCETGATLLFLSQGSVSGDVADDTPITITDGNLQLHVSSCAQ